MFIIEDEGFEPTNFLSIINQRISQYVSLCFIKYITDTFLYASYTKCTKIY